MYIVKRSNNTKSNVVELDRNLNFTFSLKAEMLTWNCNFNLSES